jgi:hypothetical protein
MLAVLASMTACGPGERADGPLGATPPSSYLCTIAGPAGVATFGSIALTNHGRTAVRLTRLTTKDASGLRVRDPALVPIVHRTLIGTEGLFPPSYARFHPAQWRQRGDIGKAVLAPGQTLNLVMGLALRTTSEGRLKEVAVHYEDKAHHYVWHSAFTVVVVQHGKPCHT